MKGDLRQLQDDLAVQGARQDAQARELAGAIQALLDSLGVQSALQSEMVVDTRGGLARELRDIQDQMSQMAQLIGQMQRTQALVLERLDAGGARVTTSTQRANPDSLGALIGRRGGDPAACDDTYEAAVTQFNRGSLNTARMAFGRFIVECADTEHRQIPTAQYNLGDIFYQENRLDQAIEEFLKVQERYPSSDQVPRALYRVGLIHVLQGNVDEAVIYFERVVNTYRDSVVADLAQDELDRIR